MISMEPRKWLPLFGLLCAVAVANGCSSTACDFPPHGCPVPGGVVTVTYVSGGDPAYLESFTLTETGLALLQSGLHGQACARLEAEERILLESFLRLPEFDALPYWTTTNRFRICCDTEEVWFHWAAGEYLTRTDLLRENPIALTFLTAIDAVASRHFKRRYTMPLQRIVRAEWQE